MPVNQSKMIKAIGIGIGSSWIAVLLLTCIVSGVMLLFRSIPTNALPYIMIAVVGISALIGGYLAAAINRSKGLITGLFCGLGVILCIFIVGLCTGRTDFGILTLVKMGVVLLCGILGGIKGVNRKEKLHIK